MLARGAAPARDAPHRNPHYYAIIKYYVEGSVLSRYLCS
jgi:hypothetical protein